MKISELEARLKEVRENIGDLPIYIANRYTHYKIRRAEYSQFTVDPHFCIRLDDNTELPREK